MILSSIVIGSTDVLAAGWALLKNFSIDDKLSELNPTGGGTQPERARVQ